MTSDQLDPLCLSSRSEQGHKNNLVWHAKEPNEKKKKWRISCTVFSGTKIGGHWVTKTLAGPSKHTAWCYPQEPL